MPDAVDGLATLCPPGGGVVVAPGDPGFALLPAAVFFGAALARRLSESSDGSMCSSPKVPDISQPVSSGWLRDEDRLALSALETGL